MDEQTPEMVSRVDQERMVGKSAEMDAIGDGSVVPLLHNGWTCLLPLVQRVAPVHWDADAHHAEYSQTHGE